MPAAWRDGDFPWEPDRDDEREAALGSAAEVVDYAAAIFAEWTDFVLGHSDELGDERVVASPRGEVAYSALLEQQLEHARFHHEQVAAFLGGA